MRCSVYKSLKQFDYYLYVQTADEFSRLPETLGRLLGKLEQVIDLELHAGRKLAQVDVFDVMRQIETQGYYLQMPPRSEATSLLS
jgi:uncharacterized protein YcgL (UPF0745 family)